MSIPEKNAMMSSAPYLSFKSLILLGSNSFLVRFFINNAVFGKSQKGAKYRTLKKQRNQIQNLKISEKSNILNFLRKMYLVFLQCSKIWTWQGHFWELKHLAPLAFPIHRKFEQPQSFLKKKSQKIQKIVKISKK